jgi:hypothetical protein
MKAFTRGEPGRQRREGAPLTRALWSAALAVAVLWPGRALSMLDGVPLDGVAEAIAFGVAVPLLWVLHRRYLDASSVRIAIASLLVIKVAGSLLLTQEGLCARFSTAAPYRTEVQTIPIDEPRGLLRSWDLRADWRAETPSCTAIVDRPYSDWSAFPAWFVNITDFVPREDRARRGESAPRHFQMDVTGVVTVAGSGRFSIDLGRDMTLDGTIGDAHVSSTDGAPVETPLEAGPHALALRIQMTGDRWRFAPLWNGQSAFAAAMLRVERSRSADRWLAPIVRAAVPAIALVILLAWLGSVAAQFRNDLFVVVWAIAASAVLVAVGISGRGERVAALLLLAAAAVPVTASARNWRGALLMLGVPWLAFFVSRAVIQVGHLSLYSYDDWLTYQVAGYRIYMNGFWLEGGSKAFDYQPLYRWLSGALHLIFGDSSVGEVYWDAACLLAGGFVAFTLVEASAGFKWALAAAAATLATFAIGTIWYFIGRGLSEIAAAGFAFFAALALLRAGAKPIAAVGAAVLAVLMFYTRLNHLIFGLVLVALVLPASISARAGRLWAAVRTLDVRPALAYVVTFTIGVMLFAMRTWWFTGVFSLLYGTSLKNNDTGLRLTTVASPDVWAKIAHGLGCLVWMNEPPTPDPRAVLVVAGALLSVLALLQVPRANRLPLSIAVTTIGATLSTFFAHTHAYPGRMSIHLVPFAVAMTVVAAATAVRSATTRPLLGAGGVPA